MSSPAHLGDACSQQIHHHHKMAYKVQFNVAPESAQQKSEQLSLDTDDFASKLFKCIHHWYQVIHFQILYSIMQMILSNWWI